MKKLIITAIVAVATLISFNANAQTSTTPGTIPAAVENPNQADITFEKETHEFGSIPQGVPASYTFVFKNTGKEPLIQMQLPVVVVPLQNGQKNQLKQVVKVTLKLLTMQLHRELLTKQLQ
jgi:hypothetical protein